MARSVLLSNSSMHVGLNIYGLVHDFYYPYVGQENHAAGRRLRHLVGVWVDGELSWLDDGSWDIKADYYGDVLVSQVIASNARLNVRLEFDDCVDSDISAWLRNVHVINMTEHEREVRLFMHQVFVIGDGFTNDTVQYLPDEPAIMHYKGHRVFIVNGTHSDGRPFDSYSVGLFGTEGHDGTFRDAEDGELMRNTVEHGCVDSVMSFHLTLRGHSSQRVHYWIAAGRTEREARRVNTIIKQDGLLHHVLKTANHWANWIKPVKRAAAKLPDEYKNGFIRSALILRSHIDKHGAVIASTDTTMLNYSRDAYAYCWPRDAAYVLWPLMRLGYTEELLNFFSFARRALHDDGYIGHKFRADGSLGSSWHPYTQHGDYIAAPIQTDETALVLFLFGQYYRDHSDKDFLKSYYRTFVAPMANFLSGYVDDEGLPRPSYDLWEEKYLTTTYTTAVTYASLVEAAYLAERAGDTESAVRWQAAAEKMHAKRAVFYNAEKKYFHKGFISNEEGRAFDDTIDSSSLFGAFMFGYFDDEDGHISDSYHTMTQTLMTHHSRVIRYEGDTYRRDHDGPSNPWPVTSLWFAQYALEKHDTEQAMNILNWVTSVMAPSGVIAEQYNKDNDTRSVAPLAWSQAEYMNTLLDMMGELPAQEMS